MGKKDKKGKAGDYWDEEFEADLNESTPKDGLNNQPDGDDAENGGSNNKEEDNEDNLGGGLMAALKKSKAKSSKKESAAPVSNGDGLTIKSKKEKEKEKKEKEKLRKKQQAERKKQQQQQYLAKAAASSPSSTGSVKTPEDSQQDDKDEANETNESIGSTSSSKKKKKGKKTSEETAASAPPASTATGGKSKKKNAVVALLQKQLEEQRREEEELKKLEEEEIKRLEQLQKEEEEKNRAAEEARQRKKEKERQKREELKAQGKLLSKKQKEQQALQQKRLQELLKSGVKIEALDSSTDEKAVKEKSKRPVYGKKKSKKQTLQNNDKADIASIASSSDIATDNVASTTTTSEKEKSNSVVEEVKPDQKSKIAVEEEEEEAVFDDWEAALDSDGEVKDIDLETPSEKKKSTSKKPEIKEKANESKKEKEKEKENKKDSDIKEQTKETQVKEKEPVTKVPETIPNHTDKSDNKELSNVNNVSNGHAVSEAKGHKEKDIVGARPGVDLRSPICCILGHVDTGKTKLLDKVRQTNVQEGEAGGITQQIGATYFPIESIKQKTEVLGIKDFDYKVPGMLIIDTPGHESFTNLRSRGSSLCNIAILVVDIMHGLEQQTLESLRLLRDRKTPFIVALNKIDRLYGWEAIPNDGFRHTLSTQSKAVQREFEDRLSKIKLAFAEQGLNSEVYYNNKNKARNVSIVPTSAVTGEGVPDMLQLIIELTQTRMSKQLMYLSQLECTVLEVKVIEGLGVTIDVILSNGVLHEGDRIVLCGLNGPIATNIRALLTPQPLRELRIKSAYVHHKEVKASLGVKIAANDLDKAIAGSRLLVVGPDDDEEEAEDEVMADLTSLLDSVDTSGRGVCVQASTLGSLEALLDFLKQMKVPVMGISIGPVFKRDVMRAATMLDRAPEYAIMLCFDVKVDKEAEQYAEEQGVRIFKADIIYHLFDDFEAYQKKLLEERREAKLNEVVYPVVLHTIQIINKRNPMIIGVDIVEGSLRIGTPICVVKGDPNSDAGRMVLNLGRVVSIEVNHKSVDNVRKGQAQGGVAMRIDTAPNQPTWGRHIDESDVLYSLVSRDSINLLKDPAFRDEVPREDWMLIRKLKPLFGIR